jgi:holliday junction DNA helicase RuvA
MFAYIKGRLTLSTPSQVIIEVSGVGYRILIPASVFSSLPALGSEIQLHTSYIVREQSQTLYGFLTTHERDFFDSLLGVTGIGPKLALSLIGHMPMHELYRAIAEGNIAAISRVPGIGKKTSERLIIEMRDKLGGLNVGDPSDFAVQAISDSGSQRVSDAMSALINLGYTQMVAQKAIKKTLKDLPEIQDLATLITLSLKNM